VQHREEFHDVRDVLERVPAHDRVGIDIDLRVAEERRDQRHALRPAASARSRSTAGS
jgi:hypothetical protein